MLRSLIHAWTPPRAYQLMQAAYHQTLPVSEPAFVTLDRWGGGSVEKYNCTAPQDVSTPAAARLTFKEDASHLRSDTYTIPEDFTATLDGALVSAQYNVVLTASGDVVVESSNAGKPEYFHPGTLAFRRERALPGHSALWRSRFHNYYHLLIDGLPRLLALDQPPHNRLDEIKLLCPGGLSETERFFIDALELENARVEELDERYHYRAEHLILTPPKTQWQSGYLPAHHVRRLRARLCPDRPPRRTERLFVSREQAGRRVLANRADLMAALRPRGFRKVVLEELSPQEQIDTLYDARVVVAPHGAGLANMLFTPPGLRVVEVFPTRYVVPHYFFLSRSLGHDYTCCCHDGDDIQTETFAADVAAVCSALN
jgi:hypothetical protein